MKLLRVILVVIFGLCLVMKTQGAEAHSLRVPAYSGPERSASTGPGIAAVTVAVLSVQQDDDGCKDGCCTSSMSCCMAALPPSGDMPVYHQASAFVAFSCAPLPQGPPLSLLRPPTFAA